MRALSALLLAAACAAPPVTAGPDAGASPDAGSTPDAGTEPSGVVFRLSFTSDVPESIYVQESGYSGYAEWITLFDASDARLPLFADCGVCSCDRCNACGVCGAALPIVAEIKAGESHDLAWDGHAYPFESCGSGSTCWARRDLAPGVYRARFCWGSAADGTGPGHTVSNSTCADESFTYPVPGGVVAHVVNDGG